MPRLDGIELLQKVRGQSHIPVFLTSKDDELDEALGLAWVLMIISLSRFLNVYWPHTVLRRAAGGVMKTSGRISSVG